jgi:hypothetical protein
MACMRAAYRDSGRIPRIPDLRPDWRCGKPGCAWRTRVRQVVRRAVGRRRTPLDGRGRRRGRRRDRIGQARGRRVHHRARHRSVGSGERGPPRLRTDRRVHDRDEAKWLPDERPTDGETSRREAARPTRRLGYASHLYSPTPRKSIPARARLDCAARSFARVAPQSAQQTSRGGSAGAGTPPPFSGTSTLAYAAEAGRPPLGRGYAFRRFAGCASLRFSQRGHARESALLRARKCGHFPELFSARSQASPAGVSRHRGRPGPPVTFRRARCRPGPARGSTRTRPKSPDTGSRSARRA